MKRPTMRTDSIRVMDVCATLASYLRQVDVPFENIGVCVCMYVCMHSH